MDISTKTDSLASLVVKEDEDTTLRLEILFDTLAQDFKKSYSIINSNKDTLYHNYFSILIGKAYVKNYAQKVLNYGEQEVKALYALGSPVTGWLINLTNYELYLELLELGAGHISICPNLPNNLSLLTYKKIILNGAHIPMESLKVSEKSLIQGTLLLASQNFAKVSSLPHLGNNVDALYPMTLDGESE